MRLFRNRRKTTVIAVTVVTLTLVAAVPGLRWRAALVACKAAGQLSDLSWVDLIDVMRPTSGIRLSRLVYYRDPYRAISNPFDGPQDVSKGTTLFASNCARCHGDAAQGGVGPALVGRSLNHGDSDWAFYRTVIHGVSGTAMAPVPLDHADIWRILAYLRQADAHRSAILPGTERTPADAAAPLSATELRGAIPGGGGWLLPSGSYSAQRFVPGGQLDKASVGKLAVRWMHQFGLADSNTIEATPLVVGTRLYVSLPSGSVVALDSRTGHVIWHFDRPPPGDVHLCCIAANRGVAVVDRLLFVGTLDAHLLALDVDTGQVVWDQTVADYREGYSITSAPLPVDDLVVTGIAGSDFPTRGFLTAYDSKTGKQRWRLYTIPGHGEPGSDTWGGNAAETGGASTWGHGSYDPELGLLFWGTGNPAPDFNASSRPGDNLYSNCVLAVDVKTGRLVWHFQFSPGDDHDWDSTQTPILIEPLREPGARKLIAVANRNGFFYVLDRETGHFVRAAAYATQTWAKEIDPNGRPVPLPGAHPSAMGATIYPSVVGATTWWPAAYSPATQLYYVDVLERRGIFFSDEHAPSPSRGRRFTGSAGTLSPDDGHYSAIRAIDVATGKVRWEHRADTDSDLPRGGVLATGGGVVFASETSRLVALDADTGARLWQLETGAQISAPPIAYEIDGHAFVAVISGQTLVVLGLPDAASR